MTRKRSLLFPTFNHTCLFPGRPPSISLKASPTLPLSLHFPRNLSLPPCLYPSLSLPPLYSLPSRSIPLNTSPSLPCILSHLPPSHPLPLPCFHAPFPSPSFSLTSHSFSFPLSHSFTASKFPILKQIIARVGQRPMKTWTTYTTYTTCTTYTTGFTLVDFFPRLSSNLKFQTIGFDSGTVFTIIGWISICQSTEGQLKVMRN